MVVPRQFQTARLLLRATELSDAESIFHEYAQDADVVRYLMWKPHSSVEDTRSFLTMCAKNWKEETEFTWSLLDKESTQLLGMIAARQKEHVIELGYVLAKKAWGQGFMSEAAGLLTDWWLNQKDIFRVQALCDIENLASARVMEKIGLQREGLLRKHTLHPNISDEPRDCFIYAKVTPSAE